jgi:2-C-methyl-D-erythritol 4-phosphate cytidylyltransferase
MNTDSVQLLLVAGGLGTRLGTQQPKALVPIGGTPIFIRALRPFFQLGVASNAIIAAPASHIEEFQELVDTEFNNHSIQVISGGKERQDSVIAGLEHLSESTEFVVIHDAARPFISEGTISNVIAAAIRAGAATAAIPCTDTILVAGDEAWLDHTPAREMLWSCQTPQVFNVSLIRDALRAASADGFSATDDASLVRRLGARVQLVNGSPDNIKVTTPADLDYAAYLVEKESIS